MKIIKFLYVLLAIVITVYCIYVDMKPLYTINQIKFEIRFLKNALEEVHPSLYWYTSKENIDKAFFRLDSAVNKPLSKREFYQLLLPVIAEIKCSHTYVSMNLDELPNVDYLPFDLWLENDDLFIVKNKSKNPKIYSGDKITHINGVSVKTIIDKAKSIQSSDGYNQTYIQDQLNSHLLEDVAWEYYGNKEPYKLKIMDTNGNTNSHIVYKRYRPEYDVLINTIKTFKYKFEHFFSIENHIKEIPNKTVELKLISKTLSTALLTINNFNYNNAETFHQSVFQTLHRRKIKSLIIDLRSNSGGNIENAVDLLCYLLSSKFRIFSSTWSRTKYPNHPSFSQYYDDNIKQLLLDNTTFLNEKDNKFFFKTGGFGWHEPKSTYNFKGDIYILVSGSTLSAASLFATALMTQKPIVSIGQETGGGLAGCSGSISQTLTLPTTGINIKIPLFRVSSISEKQNIGRGLFPDHLVHYSWQDKVNNKDLELEKALNLIKY